MSKKACVLYGATKTAEAEHLKAELEKSDCTVCLTEVTAAVGQNVQQGLMLGLPDEVAACIDGADLCFILLSDEIAEVSGSLAGAASDRGCRVVSIGGSPSDLPQALDDIIDAHLPSPGNEHLPAVIGGECIRVGPDKTRAHDRDEDRVKCQ